MTLLTFALGWLGASIVTASLWSLWRLSQRSSLLPPTRERIVAPGAKGTPWRAIP